ncbi:MAG: HAD hydrolase family protein [Tunicatimonas sp.]
MYLKILAFDLDGTLTESDNISEEIKNMLSRVKNEGFIVLLVTGRRLKAIPDITFFEDICEAIIAENGAILYFPGNDTVSLPFGELAVDVKKQLLDLDIPVEVGMAIVATWTPHDREVIEILTKTGYAASVEYNKGAVMILPPGASKGTGLRIALHDLGHSPHNLIAFGDAQNDRSLFEQGELTVAVDNASSEIKAIADVVLTKPNGTGVCNFLEGLLEDRIPVHRTKPRLQLSFGKRDEKPFYLDSVSLLNGNVGFAGSTRSGKSWLAGFLVEQLLKAEYQVCLIDPEGDYHGIRAFPQTILLGGTNDRILPVGDVITLIEYSNLSVILDLSQYPVERKLVYVEELLRALYSIRKKYGKPHWILLDEAQYFCPEKGGNLTDLIANNLKGGGMGLISYQLSQIAPVVLDAINHWMITGLKDPLEMKLLKNVMDKPIEESDYKKMESLVNGQAFVAMGNASLAEAIAPGVVEYSGVRRRIPHVRHLHKYLRAPLPESKRFYFHLNGPAKGVKPAASLWEFGEILPQLPIDTIRYHLGNEDFVRWLEDTMHDRELAKRLRKLARRDMQGEKLREKLAELVKARFAELEQLM